MKPPKGKRTPLTVAQLISLLEMVGDDDTLVEIEANMKDESVGFAELVDGKIILRRAEE